VRQTITVPAIESFNPLSNDERDALLANTVRAASTGAVSRSRTTSIFDGMKSARVIVTEQGLEHGVRRKVLALAPAIERATDEILLSRVGGPPPCVACPGGSVTGGTLVSLLTIVMQRSLLVIVAPRPEKPRSRKTESARPRSNVERL
jgi:hypothetical protein